MATNKKRATELAPKDSLFARLRAACIGEWEAYIRHAFVRRLADGSLPEASFRYYLGQDYLFLIHFARAYGLAVYKSETLADMRQAAGALSAILEVETGLHVKYCAGWGLSEAEMSALPEAPETMAYTRYVLERGLSGDLLDLHAALAPCIVGYAEIGAALTADPATKLDGNPYREWIEMYAAEEYREVARAEIDQLDRLGVARAGAERLASLIETFRRATVLETAFWEMALAAED